MIEADCDGYDLSYSLGVDGRSAHVDITREQRFSLNTSEAIVRAGAQSSCTAEVSIDLKWHVLVQCADLTVESAITAVREAVAAWPSGHRQPLQELELNASAVTEAFGPDE